MVFRVFFCDVLKYVGKNKSILKKVLVISNVLNDFVDNLIGIPMICMNKIMFSMNTYELIKFQICFKKKGKSHHREIFFIQ